MYEMHLIVSLYRSGQWPLHFASHPPIHTATHTLNGRVAMQDAGLPIGSNFRFRVFPTCPWESGILFKDTWAPLSFYTGLSELYIRHHSFKSSDTGNVISLSKESFGSITWHSRRRHKHCRNRSAKCQVDKARQRRREWMGGDRGWILFLTSRLKRCRQK